MSVDMPETTTSLGRRERNKQRVRERLYNSAMTLFAERGYDQTSVGEIAEHADVARGTFFNYFQRKEDLISAWGERRRAALEKSLAQDRSSAAPDTLSQLEQCMSTLSQINESEGTLVVPMLTAWVKAGHPLSEEPYVAKTFAKIVERGQARGEINAMVDSARIGFMLRDIYLGTLFRWSQSTEGRAGFSLGDDLRASLAAMVSGIAACPHHSGPQ
ncbi:TetR/AcrR family transcriptional regulator [Streptomyces sp. VRA16 Mangrove soil]|uniref:TetR/AcrR family transcriptional regulator n=1 Tax=Streptomyces sp. VRA16 Mangrove soil TaxID=2817434 RepID=UPI001A9CE952|nr:TetR/AcrR family transcriptional regulator [Streptomyces sp. VRA16 Mangrove soil]MBO1337157.1 TetR/AcrR family transcriptional regulator [Streptomyces sp. VRA16 Mangrove soil]